MNNHSSNLFLLSVGLFSKIMATMVANNAELSAVANTLAILASICVVSNFLFHLIMKFRNFMKKKQES